MQEARELSEEDAGRVIGLLRKGLMVQPLLGSKAMFECLPPGFLSLVSLVDARNLVSLVSLASLAAKRARGQARA